ncbi:MAG TPA: phosphotransferase, partial [Bacillota bacterium]
LEVARVFDPTAKRAIVLKGGGRKAVWLVRAAAGDFVLKRHHYNKKRLRFVVGLQTYCYERGGPVPAPRADAAGRLLRQRGGRIFSAQQWIEAAIPPRLADADHLAAYARALAAFHQAARGYEPPPDSLRRDHGRRLPARLRFVGRRLRRMARLAARGCEPYAAARRQLDRARRRASRLLKRLDAQRYRDWLVQARKEGQIVHADLGPANALYRGGCCWIIDLDAAGYGPRVYDLAVLLVKACRSAPQGRLADTLHLGLSAYQSISPLGPDERVYLRWLLAYPWDSGRFWHKRRKYGPRWDRRALRGELARDRERARAVRLLLGRNEEPWQGLPHTIPNLLPLAGPFDPWLS